MVFDEIGIERIKDALNDGKEYETNSEMLLALHDKANKIDPHDTASVLTYVEELKAIVEGFLIIVEKPKVKKDSNCMFDVEL
jgi:hypothetical protein